MSDFDDAVQHLRRDLIDRDAVARLFSGDHTLWRSDPTELADRLGWVPVIAEVEADLPGLTKRCDALVDGIEHVLVMGMGGSSLFPEVLARTLLPAPNRPRLHVLDTTDPVAIARIGLECDPDVTLHVASSKSGSTIETRSHLEWAWARAHGRGRFAVITDPGSELGDLARERGFAEVFENRPDIGGRYSALSLFGVVPGLLMGVDVAALLQGGIDALAHSGPKVDPEENPAIQLATAIAAGVRTGRDKATFLLDPALTAMGLWVEQLVAESLGKDGTGAVPIVSEPLGPPTVYGDDRLFLAQLPIDELQAAGHPAVVGGSDASPHGIGHMAVTMELAVALAGAAIGVQPFDQPDVAAAKAATAEVLAEGGAEIPETPLADLLSTAPTRRPPRASKRSSTRARPSSIVSKRPESGSAIVTAWPPASASAPATSTPRASSTRAGPAPSCASRSSAKTCRTSRSRGSPTASVTSCAPKRLATCAPSSPEASEPPASPSPTSSRSDHDEPPREVAEPPGGAATGEPGWRSQAPRRGAP